MNRLRNNIKLRQMVNTIRFNMKKYKKPHKPWPKPHDFFQKRQSLLYYNIGLYTLVFGMCYLTIPLYRVFCESVGLEGDLAQKDYSVDEDKAKKINVFRKFKVIFESDVDEEVNWTFEPIQSELVVNAGETALAFYRVKNNEEFPVIGFSTYSVFPEEATLYFSKIQCFCFHQQMIQPKEELQLPLFFYFEPEIQDDRILQGIENVTIIYRFFRAKKQDIVRMAQEEMERNETNKSIIEGIRQQKKLQQQHQKQIEN